MSAQRKPVIPILHALLIVAAYGYLAYMLATFEHYGELAEHFRKAGWLEWGALALCIGLFPLNIFLEAWKWRSLLRNVADISLREAQAQVYFGMVGAFLTPQRLGDYPARASRIEDSSKWLPAVTLGFVGSIALTMVNVICGLWPFAFLGSMLFGSLDSSPVYWGAGITVLCGMAAVVAFPAICRWLKYKTLWGEHPRSFVCMIADFPLQRFPYLVMQSACRYAVFCLQLWLALVFCGVSMPMPVIWLMAIPVYYMLVTVLPSVPAADVAIRGSVAVMVFGTLSQNDAAAALAITLLWIVNGILPMAIGTCVKKKA